MHDWPDAECLTILSQLAEAMDGDSRILMDEVVLPDANVPWQAAMQDISMNIQFGGKIRKATAIIQFVCGLKASLLQQRQC